MKKYIKASRTATISSLVRDPEDVRSNLEQILRTDIRDHANRSDSLGLTDLTLSDDMTIKFHVNNPDMPMLNVVTEYDGEYFTFETELSFPELNSSYLGSSDMAGILKDWHVFAQVADYLSSLQIDPLNYSEYD